MKNYALILLFLFLPLAYAAAQDSTQVKQALPQRVIPATAAAWYGAQKVRPLNYNYYNSLGAACKAELKLEKATNIPFRFRLGSLAQTDYMEQKPHAAKPEHP
jgi:hypothetical protein